MALVEELEKSGNWLFRWRSYLPLLLIGLFVVALWDHERPGSGQRLDRVWEVLGLLMTVIGVLVRSHTVGHTPAGTSGRNTRRQVAESLNTTGAASGRRISASR